MNFLEELPRGMLYALAFLVPLACVLVLTPAVARLAHRYRVLDHPGGHKVHGDATPYLGGLAVGAGLMLVGVVVAGTNGELLTIMGAALALGMVGLRDDFRSVSPWWRLGFEAAAGLALWTVGVRAGVFGLAITDLPLTILWIVAVVNAFNMIDNMDGVASAVAGASLGFLRANFPPASIFLGDAGSMFLGFMIAALTLKLDLPVGDVAPRVISTVLLAAVPLFDLTLVMLARAMGRRPLMAGGTDHTTHRLRRGGSPDRTVLLQLIAVQASCSLLAYTVYQQERAFVLVIGAAVAVTWLLLLWVFLRMSEPSRETTERVAVTS